MSQTGIRRGYPIEYVGTVRFVPDVSLLDAIDPAYAPRRKARVRWWRESRRRLRESTRAFRAEQRRLYGRKHKTSGAVRRIVYRRDGGTCVRCGTQVDWREWRYHHVIPCPEGPESAENLVTLCLGCHEWLHDWSGRLATRRARLSRFRQRWHKARRGGRRDVVQGLAGT